MSKILLKFVSASAESAFRVQGLWYVHIDGQLSFTTTTVSHPLLKGIKGENRMEKKKKNKKACGLR